MSFLGGLFGSKPKDYVIRPGEYAELYRQERMGASPNVNNWLGGSQVTWDGDQATVTNTLSPELQGLANQMMGSLSQGPATLGNYSNPYIEQLLGNVGGGIAGRMGLQAPQVNMGGYSGGNQPSFAPVQSSEMGPQPVAEPQQSLGYTPAEQQGLPEVSYSGGGYGGGGGGYSPYAQMIQDWQQRQRMSQPIDYRTRS
jgi:hypothetical protein